MSCSYRGDGGCSVTCIGEALYRDGEIHSVCQIPANHHDTDCHTAAVGLIGGLVEFDLCHIWNEVQTAYHRL